MKLPKLSKYGRGDNGTLVDLDVVSVWFSYKTPVAFLVAGQTMVVHENDWGTVTGQHLSAIDGGDKEAKARRVSHEEFERQWKKQVPEVMREMLEVEA